MTIASVGTPTAATSTTITSNVVTVAGSWGTGQNRTAENLLVAVITFNATTSAAATAQAAGTSGWTNQVEIGSAATALARTAIWTAVAAGGDAAPSFTSNVAASASALGSITLYELSGATQFNIVDASGTNALVSTIATQTATTSGNVTLAGEFGIAGFARERATIASNITASGSYTLDTSNTGVNSIGHFATMSLAGPGTGSTSAATVNYSGTSTTARGAAAVIVFSVATAGPVISTASQPPGVRVIRLRKGSAAATTLSATPVVPPPPPTSGPPFYPAVQAIRARLPQPPAGMGAMRGRVTSNPGAPVRNPAPGPVFRQKPAPVRAVLPPWRPRAGRIGSSFGIPVAVPHRGPPVYAPLGPVRARQPLPRRGRVASNPGGPVANPNAVAVYGAVPGPVRASLPANPRGRVRVTPVAAASGIPPVHAGPPFYPAVQALRARLPQPLLRGRVASNPGGPVRNPSSGPAFRPLPYPVRAKTPLFRLGRTESLASAVRNPVQGPVFYPAVRPVRAPVPQVFSRGRVSSGPGAPVRNPSAGPVFAAAVRPAQARIPQTFSKGRVSANPGAPVRNPGSGPAFRQAVQPVRARQPLPPRGRCASNPGGPVQNPAPVVIGPPFYPVTRVRPQPGPRPGGIFASTIAAPGQATAATIAYNTGTTASAITATSVGLTIPSGVLTGDLMVLGVTLFTTDASQPSVSITGGAWMLVSVTTGTNPEVPTGSGVFSYDFAYTRVATGIDPGASITLSETGSGAGGTWWGVALAAYTGASAVDVAGGANAQGGGGTTVTCPSETTTATGDWAVYVGGGAPGGGTNWTVPAGTTTRQAVVSAAGIGAVITDSNGPLSSGSSIGGGTFASSNPGATVWLSAFTLGVNPQVTPAALVTLASQFATGRIAFSYGAPVTNPVQGAPAPALRQPVRARQPLPARGRIASNPGAPVAVPPVTGPVFRPATTPARARITLPPRGRTASNPGAPVSNPAQGPVFRQATAPARSRIPQVFPRGVYAAVPVTPPQAPAGTITYNTGASNTADTAASINLTIPAGVLPGDVMVLAVTCFTQDASAPAVTLSGGSWNLVNVGTGTNPEVSSGSGIFSYQYAWTRAATGADPGSTLTISETGSPAGTTWWAAAVASYTGAYGSAPVDVAGSAQAQGAAVAVACPSETTTANGDWGVYLGGGAPGVGTSFVIPAGSTQRQAVVSDAGIGIVIADGNGSAGGAGSSVGGGSFKSSGSGVVWLTAFTVGLAATPQPAPAQSYAAQYATGRVAFSYGGQVRNPPVPGPVFYPLNHPVQAKALPRRRGLCRAIRFVPLTGNPTQGPQFYPAVQPVQARLPVPFLKGRVSSNAGGPVSNPVPPSMGPVFRQADSPAAARRPLPPRGRTASNPGAPVQNPHQGPVFRQATSPARIRPVLPPRGRTGFNPGGPVQNPPPPVNGPVFYQKTSPARIRPTLPPRGRVASSPGGPVLNPVQGAAFPAQHSPVQARFPLPPKGRASGSRGVLAPLPVPAPVYPWHGPVAAKTTLPRKGRTAGNPGTAPATPAPVYPWHGPVVARRPLPQRGRTAGNPGIPVTIPAPVYAWHGPVRVHPSLPPRGRTSGNPGTPVAPPPVPAPVYPLHGPVAARRPLPPRGQVYTGNPGGPVRNPHQGTVFHSLPWPSRARIPQNAPRGRTASNPGGPVENIPFATLKFRTGTPYFQWAPGIPGYQWAPGTTGLQWATGTPETG